MWKKIKLTISIAVGFIISALSAICYVLFKQKQDEKKIAEEATKQVKELKKQVEVQDEFDIIQREEDKKAAEKHTAVDSSVTPVSDVMQDLHNNSKNRVRVRKQ